MNGNGTRVRNALLIALLLLLLAGGWLLRPDTSRRNYEFLPDMAHSPAAGSFSRHPELPLGMTQQPPVPGTVARGQLPLRAGRDLTSPLVKATAADRTRGAEVFAGFCAPCHGTGGQGDGPVARRGYPPPPSLLAEQARKLTDGSLFHIITHGQGNMAPYAPQLQRLDRWKVILHIRTLQQQ